MLALLSVPVYATLAFRGAYGGGVVKTLAKEVGIAAIYSFATIIALLLTAYGVALYG